MATPEGKVKTAVKKELKARGIWWYMPSQNGMGVVGIPDLICCYKGLFIAIETKAPNKRPTSFEQRWKKATANQQLRITEIRKAGGVAIVVDDVQQVIDLLDELTPLAILLIKARTKLWRVRQWPETIKKSIGSIMVPPNRRKSGPSEMLPEDVPNEKDV